MQTTTLQVALVVLATLITVGAGCDGGTPPPLPGPSTATTTLVFVDRSVSADATAETKALFADTLARVVDNSMKWKGDRISLYPVHERTLSKVGRVNVVNDVELPQRKSFVQDQETELIRHRKETMRYLNTAAEDLQDRLAQMTVDENFARWTNLWATLGVASEELPRDSSRKQIYYFSDMFESMPGSERRNFDRRPPQSREEAESWAQADAEELSKYMTLSPEALRGAKVRVIQGSMAAKDNAPYVKFYWLELFQEVGLQNVRYN